MIHSFNIYDSLFFCAQDRKLIPTYHVLYLDIFFLRIITVITMD